ncbi:hypothetical protein J8L70_10710 [Pseudoalteromonas sp. MMG010]|nr:hypothetical protein [Pseudoalteromonas sp. MMG010]
MNRNISYVICFCILLIVTWILGGVSTEQKPLAFPVLINTSMQCLTSAKGNKDQLIIFTPSKQDANSLSLKLCEDATVARQFGKVVGYWGYKPADSVEFIGKGIADLIMAKNNIMDAFTAEFTYNYQPVAGFADYTAFFISAKEKPQINKQYLLGKKIGLLDYPTSRSGHILPKQTFKKLGFSADELNITYASSHDELRTLLANGEVDIISSYWKDSDNALFSKNYITPINRQVTGTRWYLKMQQNNIDLLCAVQKNIQAMSKEQPLHYYQNVQTYWQCNEQGAEFLGEVHND